MKRAYRRVIKHGSAITADSPAEQLHTLRKRCKELRYLLEIFASLHEPTAHRRVVKELKALQECLGDFQDGEVQRRTVGAYVTQMTNEATVPTDTLLAMGELAAHVDTRKRQARSDYADRWDQFTRGKNRRAVAQLHAGDRGVRIFATYNIKGGVGKTTTAVNLAYLAARDGQRTLLWDLDPQGAACTSSASGQVKGGAKALIRGARSLDDGVKGTDFDNLDLLPADFTTATWTWSSTRRRTRRRGSATPETARATRRRVFLDCPPSISLVSENVMHAVDTLLVPLIPTTLSLRTLDQLTRFIAGVRGTTSRGARVLLHGRPAQAPPSGRDGTPVRRALLDRRYRYTCSVDHRADGRAPPPRSQRSHRGARHRAPMPVCGPEFQQQP